MWPFALCLLALAALGRESTGVKNAPAVEPDSVDAAQDPGIVDPAEALDAVVYGDAEMDEDEGTGDIEDENAEDEAPADIVGAAPLSDGETRAWTGLVQNARTNVQSVYLVIVKKSAQQSITEMKLAYLRALKARHEREEARRDRWTRDRVLRCMRLVQALAGWIVAEFVATRHWPRWQI